MELKKLNPSSYVPLYQQLKDIIVGKIEQGDWQPDDRIYSENQLFEMFGVSRNTAKKAIEDLEQEGIVYRVQGKGTFVSQPKIEQSLTGFYSFSQVLEEKGLEPKDEVINISIEGATRKVAHALQLEVGREVVVLQRLRYAQEEPIILESSYLCKEDIPDVEALRQVGEVPLYTLLRQVFHVQVNTAKEAFEPVLIKAHESEYLDVKTGSPALLLERIAYNEQKRPVEFCKSIVRGDRCKFYTELF